MRSDDRGYAMAALLVALSVMGIMLSIALPVWRTWVQREREAELVFRGEQYAQAIALFNRRTGGFPTSLDALRAGRYIRKLYKDPITDGDFQPVYFGQIAAGAPGMPPQAGRGAQAGAPPAALGVARGGLAAAGRAGQASAAPGRSGGQTPAAITGGFGFGQSTPGMPGQPGAVGAGPIIGVVSKSTGEALRLYNGRGHYNEWLFVSTAATQQPGAPAGAQTPGPPGTGAQGGVPQPGARGGRGTSPRRGPPPGAPSPFGPPSGAPNPFGRPGGLPFPGSPNQPRR